MPSENGEFLAKKIITLETLSSLSVLSVRQLNRLIKARVITLATNKKGQPLRGRVFLGEAVPKLFEYVRDSIVMDDPSERRYRAARARKQECAAKSAQIELDYERGKYLLASNVREHGEAMLLMCRSRLLAIPSSISRSLIGVVEFRKIYQIIESAIHLALNELADLATMGQRDRERAVRKLMYYQGDETDKGNGSHDNAD